MTNGLFPTCFLAAAVFAACDKQSAPQSPGPSEAFVTVLPHYPTSEFLQLPSFRARVLSKTILAYPGLERGTSNFLASISLERERGDRVAVTFRPATEELIKILSSLKEGQNFTFPDVLRASGQ